MKTVDSFFYTLTYGDSYSLVSIPFLEGRKIMCTPDDYFTDDRYLDTNHFSYMAYFEPVDSDVFSSIRIEKEGGNGDSARASSYYEKLTKPEAECIIRSFIKDSLGIDDFELVTDSTCFILENEIPMDEEDNDYEGTDDEDDEYEDEEDRIDWGSYCDFPYAMESVNGQIINMSVDMMKMVKEKIVEKLHVSQSDLAEYLLSCCEAEENFDEDEDEYIDDRFDEICDIEYYTIAELTGFNFESGEFEPERIGFLESSSGWDAKDLFERLGISLSLDYSEGAHGHDSSGVYYFKRDY